MSIDRQFEIAKRQVEIIEYQKSHSNSKVDISSKEETEIKTKVKDLVILSPKFKESKSTVFGYNPNL
jgi:prephenate dehydrogenase